MSSTSSESCNPDATTTIKVPAPPVATAPAKPAVSPAPQSSTIEEPSPDPSTPTGAQVAMGSAVDAAANKAKADIGALIPQAEAAILTEQKKLEEQLGEAEEALVGEENPERVERRNVAQSSETPEEAAAILAGPTAAQTAMGNAVDSAANQAKADIGALIPEAEKAIEEKEEMRKGKLSEAEDALTSGINEEKTTEKTETNMQRSRREYLETRKALQ